MGIYVVGNRLLYGDHDQELYPNTTFHVKGIDVNSFIFLLFFLFMLESNTIDHDPAYSHASIRMHRRSIASAIAYSQKMKIIHR